MSEFTFTCPICGQNVLCHTALAGTRLNCPHCKNSIGVPVSFAETDEVPPETDIPPVSPETATPVQKTSGMAIASLVCSLASFVLCVGWLPGIICGHIANSRIRRDPSLKGSGIAKAGLVIGYLFLILEAGTAAVYTWRISTAVKQGYENAREDLATNNFIVQIQPTNAPAITQQPQPVTPTVIATKTPPPGPVRNGWTSDIAEVAFPDRPIAGSLHGIDFTLKTAIFRNGALRINSNEGTSVEILHGLGESIDGQSYSILTSDDDTANPRIRMTWTENDVVQTQTFGKGYGLKLQFGQITNRKVSAKIYLCLPDDSKSFLAGTFEVRIPKPKAAAQGN